MIITLGDVHHDCGREDADPDQEVGHPEREDEAVGHGAQLGGRQHGRNDQEVADLKKRDREMTFTNCCY